MRKIPFILVISLVLACGLALQAGAIPVPTSVIDIPKGNVCLAPPFADVFITVTGGTAHVDVEADQGYTMTISRA